MWNVQIKYPIVLKAEKAEKVEETTLHLEKTLARNQFVVQVEQ